MAVISKGLELWMKSATNAPISYTELDKTSNEPRTVSTKVTYNAVEYQLINGLQEVGELNGLATAAEREKIEVTTLKDDRHVYVDGIIADSDTEAIEFKLLYDAKLFNALKDAAEAALNFDGEKDKFALSIDRADGTFASNTYTVDEEDFKGFASWTGVITGIKLDSVSVNSALTMTLTVAPEGAITLA